MARSCGPESGTRCLARDCAFGSKRVTVCTVAALSAATANAALSVAHHATDEMVLRMRGAIFFEDGDLASMAGWGRCSSVDGPCCSLWCSEGVDWQAVDGVIPDRLRRGLFAKTDWDASQVATFTSTISESAQTPGGVGVNLARSVKSRTRCYRVAFWRLAPTDLQMPPRYSLGLPPTLRVTWEGNWDVTNVEFPRRGRSSSSQTSRWPTWSTDVTLRTVEGRISFSSPIVLQRLLIGAGTPMRPPHQELMVYGKLRGASKWRTVIPNTFLQSSVVEASSGEGQSHLGGADFANGYVNVAQSFYSIDEIAFVGSNIRVWLIELSASTFAERPQEIALEQTEVLVMKRSSSTFLPIKSRVSRDALLWNVNEVLMHRMQLRQNSGPNILRLQLPLHGGGCCQFSADDTRCAPHEYPNGKCTTLSTRSIGCKRGWWREGAQYDDATGLCVSQVWLPQPHGSR